MVLKALRQKANLTAEKVADLVGLRQSNVTAYEKRFENRSITLKSLIRLASACGYKVQVVFVKDTEEVRVDVQ
nr:hypothetical protein BdHM001_35530 [Bdellovibrio sp. HM001]